MSEAVFQPRVRVTRVRSLGDAVPIGRGPFADTGDDEKIVANTGDELRAERDAARDAQPMTTTCRVETCDFAYTGTAGDCRDAAATHRAASHPELAGARTHRSGVTEQLAIDVADRSADFAVRTAKPLTGRQQLALDYVATHDGVTADEVGALTSKALRPLLTYRRADGGNLYLLRDPADRRGAADAGSEQVSVQIPDDPFKGL